MASTRSRRAIAGVAAALAVLAVVVVVLRGEPFAPAAVVDGAAGEEIPADDATKREDEPSADHSPQDEWTDGTPANDAGEGALQERNATGERWEVRRTEGDTSFAASEVLKGYKEEGDCVLCRAGYVDLFQNVWSCVVQGPGWVDVCVVSQADDSSASEVKTLRMEVGEWGKDIAEK